MTVMEIDIDTLKEMQACVDKIVNIHDISVDVRIGAYAIILLVDDSLVYEVKLHILEGESPSVVYCLNDSNKGVFRELEAFFNSKNYDMVYQSEKNPQIYINFMKLSDYIKKETQSNA